MLLKCGACLRSSVPEEKTRYAQYRCGLCGHVNEVLNVPLREWLGFQYHEYVEEIKKSIVKDRFVTLLAKSAADRKRGFLTTQQIKVLKGILIEQFSRGGTIRDIRNDIRTLVKPGDRIMNNKKKTVIPANKREIMIARSETTRFANLGAKEHYKKGGVESYTWVASFSERTCAVCEELNGQVFPITASEQPPAHANCRCTIIPVVTT